MRRPLAARILNSYFFRASSLFLALLGIGLGAYFLWIEAEVSSPYKNDDEEDWYRNRAKTELDTLAGNVADALVLGAPATGLIRDFGARVAKYDAELLVCDPSGTALMGSDPDSLVAAVMHVDPSLLLSMTGKDWDFESYPIAEDINAYENRIFQVRRLARADTTQPSLGFLVASFRPMILTATQLEEGNALLGRQPLLVKVLVGMLIFAAIITLVIMGWTGRRVSVLSDGVEAFAAGRLDRRIEDASPDELGRLARNFNVMASHIEGMVESLRRKEQFQRELIANVSHDLRTPLASARGHAETLGLRFAHLSPADRERSVGMITANLDHLERLVERMLVLSRIDSQQAVLQPETFPLAELGAMILDRCGPVAAAAGVNLELDMPADLPPVHADPLQISQVLQNLVENGVKFNAPGGAVTLGARVAPDGVEVTVRDDGIGIAAEDLPHIFDRFYTGNRSRTRGGEPAADLGPAQHSSGLGLAIAAKIVELHGGTLQVASERGRGAAFTFRLPVGRDEADARDPHREAAG